MVKCESRLVHRTKLLQIEDRSFLHNTSLRSIQHHEYLTQISRWDEIHSTCQAHSQNLVCWSFGSWLAMDLKILSISTWLLISQWSIKFWHCKITSVIKKCQILSSLTVVKAVPKLDWTDVNREYQFRNVTLRTLPSEASIRSQYSQAALSNNGASLLLLLCNNGTWVVSTRCIEVLASNCSYNFRNIPAIRMRLLTESKMIVD